MFLAALILHYALTAVAVAALAKLATRVVAADYILRTATATHQTVRPARNISTGVGIAATVSG